MSVGIAMGITSSDPRDCHQISMRKVLQKSYRLFSTMGKTHLIQLKSVAPLLGTGVGEFPQSQFSNNSAWQCVGFVQ